MRLINTTTEQFEEFFDTQLPQYAILSHRWGRGEISHQDYLDGGMSGDSNLATQGRTKIDNCVCFARERGLEWVWIDTCCIDKKSSAELTEAINSMYSWYAQATECYALLSDVPSKDDASPEQRDRAFRHSAWFSRGWTLQELLAPRELLFVDSAWNAIGGKKQYANVISHVTGIPAPFLRGVSLTKASVAMRMSWIARRQTTRLEDLAYCLLGIFNVNMPLLYGEGKKAFMRLQLEIIRKSDDESIFAWTSDNLEECGMLALWPTAFANSGNIVLSEATFEGHISYGMTNKGLELRQFGTFRNGDFYDELRATPSGPSEATISLDCFQAAVAMNPREQEPQRLPKASVITIRLRRAGWKWRRIDYSCFSHLYLDEERDTYSPRSDVGRTQRLYYVQQPGL